MDRSSRRLTPSPLDEIAGLLDGHPHADEAARDPFVFMLTILGSEIIIMPNLTRALLLAACLAATACDSPTDGDDPPLPLGETVVATTAATGQATVTLQGGGDEYQIPLLLRDFDTERGVASLEVHAVALAEGIFLRTEDPAGRYFSSTQYIPYAQFQRTEGTQASFSFSGEGSTVGPRPIAWVAGIGLVIAVYSVGSALYEFATDPPGIEEAFNDRGVREVCVTGDLNDALSAWGLGGVRTVSGAIKVFGAPARLRGVTSINLGFTRVNVVTDAAIEELTWYVDRFTGLLDTDHKVWCWPEVEGKVIPVIRGQITRTTTPFDITQVLSQAVYPVMPTRSQITTTVGAQWSGSPVFPVDMIVTPVSCYPGWVCYDWSQRFATQTNPMRVTFGCWGSDPSARSGSMTFQVVLRDRNGLTTPPATYNFRCGSGADRLAPASLQPSGADAPAGFAGPLGPG